MSMRLLVSFVLLIVASFSGCSQSNAPSNAEYPKEKSQPASDVASEEQYPRIRWKWISADGKKIESMGSPISTSDPSIRIVEDKFRQLDWSDSALKPTFTIERAGDRSLTIMLSPETSDNHEMIAVLRIPGLKYGNTTTTLVRRSRPLNNAEQALSLLRSYAVDAGDFESLVDWVAQDADSPKKRD